jgi:hypothetical protein
VLGEAPDSSIINSITDIASDTVNDTITPGGIANLKVYQPGQQGCNFCPVYRHRYKRSVENKLYDSGYPVCGQFPVEHRYAVQRRQGMQGREDPYARLRAERRINDYANAGVHDIWAQAAVQNLSTLHTGRNTPL